MKLLPGSPITVIASWRAGGHEALHLRYTQKEALVWVSAYGYDGSNYHSITIELKDKNKSWFEGHIPKDDPRILSELVARALLAEV